MPTKNEAVGTGFTVTYNGTDYLVPPSEDWDIAVLEALDDQKLTYVIRALLGAEQYKVFRANNHRIKDLNAFFELVQKATNAKN